MDATSVQFYTTGTCTYCGKGRIIAPWGTDPACFLCHGWYITRVEYLEGKKVAHLERPTCQYCGEKKDGEGICRCNHEED